MNQSAQPEKSKKRRSTSLPLILGFLIVGGLAYYFDAGLHIMTYVMFLQESSKSDSERKKGLAQELIDKEEFEAGQKAIFLTKDENGDGKLDEKEIGGQFAELDRDKDGSVSLIEFVAGPANQGGGMAMPFDDEPPIIAEPPKGAEPPTGAGPPSENKE